MAVNIINENLLPVGTLLSGGRYRILKHLSSGGFGKTYLAEYVALDQKVVIKEHYIKGMCGRDATSQQITVTLEENRASFDALRNKFRKEAKRLFGLKNPHIVNVHDLFDENGTSYYVMDYVDGDSLSARLKQGGALTEKQVMDLLPQVLDALQAIHAKHIWHLDLKPANIMVDREGQVHLIDFGASKQPVSDDGEQLSTSSAMAYTPGYASSEQMYQSIDKFGPWTDLYSLGATVYNLITRQTPPTPADISENPTSAFASLQNVSERMRQLVKWLMQPNRPQRPQSAAEVLAWLARPNASSPMPASPAAPAHVVTPRPPINDDDTVVRDSSQRVEAKPTTNTTPKAKGKSKGMLYGAIATGAVAVIVLLVVLMGGKSKGTFTKDGNTFTVNGVSFNMVPVEGGTFTMGATSEQGRDAWDNEKPAHSVTLSDYSIGETEVTQALWQAVMGSNPSEFKGDDKPVECVCWDDCQTFIKKLNELTGENFRLPTEAEWEYAARGGNKSKGYKYSGSNALDDVAWFGDNAYNVGESSSAYGTHAVKTKAPNELGIYDMSGNVWEWCNDWYGNYSSNSLTNPTGPGSGSYRVCRGGGWDDDAWFCRVSCRINGLPAYSGDLGLRLAR